VAEHLPSPFDPSERSTSADGSFFDIDIPSGAHTRQAATLEALLQPRLSLFWGAQTPTRSLLTAATTIAAGGLSLRLFDGGNSFDGYFVARLARQLALAAARSSATRADPLRDARRDPLRDAPSGVPPGYPLQGAKRDEDAMRSATKSDPYDILDRMHLSRAFTCFQLAELIETAPAGPEPLFVLDLLATFYDESVPLRDSERLLATVLTHLRRLAAVGPVIVGGREPQTLVKERWLLLDQLQAAADAAWMLRPPPAEAVLQPRLF
jgi:hypothetical protein